jgi:hypothetical protein
MDSQNVAHVADGMATAETGLSCALFAESGAAHAFCADMSYK